MIDALTLPDAPIALGISGGVDSIVLWHYAQQHPYPLHIIHCNHQQRSDADTDARWLQNLFHQWSRPHDQLHIFTWDNAPDNASENAMRSWRYDECKNM